MTSNARVKGTNSEKAHGVNLLDAVWSVFTAPFVLLLVLLRLLDNALKQSIKARATRVWERGFYIEVGDKYPPFEAEEDGDE